MIQHGIEVSKIKGLNIFIICNIFCMKISINKCINEVFADLR